MDREKARKRELEKVRIGAELAQRLREQRKALGYSVDKLAELSGVGRAQIVRIERGEGGDAGLTTVASLARGLDVAPSWLAFDDSIDRKP